MPQRPMEAVREDETFTITDLAAEFGVTPRAIRFYEGEGLIEPARQGQNRVYSRRDRARLAWILRGKNVGFSLAEIKEILDLYHAGDGRVRQRERTLELCRRQIGVLTNQRNDIDATLAELQEFVAVVEGLLPSNAKSGES
ncbi:MerR family DNA-binding transcriptional regulator [Sphingosinicella sp.]|jgi:DNA-binding transcriptional MerR regulator|uniref:MerR family DNA-binding transcriptional regulator n=1 Tax=Sphingosinicella xenopeptidilytica TaxID=364098 RepID=A0ABW3C729_SPHXN|nr:MerR family DNA-binding transcriptional regulator [Sphingosinicella sp.]